jgi:hypothetical protein
MVPSHLGGFGDYDRFYLWGGVESMGTIINIDLNKVEYELGVSYKQALSMVTRLVNESYDLIAVLQNRVSELERYVEKTQGYL